MAGGLRGKRLPAPVALSGYLIQITVLEKPSDIACCSLSEPFSPFTSNGHGSNAHSNAHDSGTGNSGGDNNTLGQRY